MSAFSQTQFQTLFAYTFHTGLHLLDCAARVSEAEYKDNPGYGHGSIHDLGFHLMRTDQSWRIALQSGQQQAGLSPEEFPDLASVRAGLLAEQQAWQAYLQGLSSAQIEGEIHLTTRRGGAFVIPIWRVLQHLALHGMQHHAELAHLLTARGQSPGDIDFIFYDPPA